MSERFPLHAGVLPIENITQSVPTVDSNHAQIHEKNGFSLSGTLVVAATDFGAIQLDVPAGSYVHFQALSFSVNGGPCTVALMEDYTLDATAAAAATELTPMNHHRIAPPASLLTANAHADVTPTAGTAGLTLATVFVPGATQGNNRVGAQSGQSEEWVLNPATSYLITMLNNAGTSTTFGYYLFWYEESAA